MEYVIGTIQKGAKLHTILKTKDTHHTELQGHTALEQVRGNTKIRDTFTVIQKYLSIDSTDGYCYDWYYIDNHYCNEDRTEEIRTTLEQNITDIEIEAIEKDQVITDNEIAIIELQNAVKVLASTI